MVLGNMFYVPTTFRGFCVNRYSHKREERGPFCKFRGLASKLLPTIAGPARRRRDPTSFSPPADCRLWALAGPLKDPRAPITDSLRMRRTARPVSFCTGLRKEKPPAAAIARQMASFTETKIFFRFLSLFSVLLGHNRHIWCSREECAYIAWTLQGKCDARGRRGEGERSEYGRREDHL